MSPGATLGHFGGHFSPLFDHLVYDVFVKCFEVLFRYHLGAPNHQLGLQSGCFVVARAKEGDFVKVGIRPEHLLVNQDSDSNWESKVLVVEKLGSGTFLYLEKNDELLVVQTDGDSKIKVGDVVKIGFDASRCHIFDDTNQAFK